MESEPLSLS